MARITYGTLVEADPKVLWKLILRTSSVILAAIAIGLIAWAEIHVVIPILDPNNIDNGTPDSLFYESQLGGPLYGNSDDLALPWEYISLGLSIAWSLTNIGVWFTPSRSGRGVHPGANVGCDLILWIILLLTGIFASAAAASYISSFGVEQGDYYDTDAVLSNGTHVTTLQNGTEVLDPNQCAPFLNCGDVSAYNTAIYHKGVVIAVGVAFTFIVMLLHFALFISACRYTHARRYANSKRYAKAITDEATAIATKMVKDMGYPPPAQWQIQSQPQSEPKGGEQLPMGALTTNNPAEREVQGGYDQPMSEPQQQHDGSVGNSKGKEKDLEQGQGPLGSIATMAGERSSGQHPPNIRVETPGGGEAGMIR